MYLTLLVFCLLLVVAAAWFKRLLPHIIQYIFFVRFSILMGLLLVFLGFAKPSVLPDLFQLHGIGLVVVSALTMFIAWGCMITALVTFHMAPHRFGVVEIHLPRWAIRNRFLLSSCLAAPLLLRFSLRPHGNLQDVADIIAGVMLAFAGLWVVTLIRVFFVPPHTAPPVLLSERSFPAAIRNADPLRLLTRVITPDRLRKFPRVLGAGYIDYGAGRVRAGPLWLLILLAAIGLACTYANWRVDWRLIHHAPVTFLPTLAYLEIGLVILTLLLPGLSFFFDRYRVSVMLVVAAWIAMPYWTQKTGHYFPIYVVECRNPPSDKATISASCALPAPVGDAIEPWLKSEEAAGVRRPVMFVLCASGGGAQASAWTARVLTGLQEEFGPGFTRSIRLMSGVSGGSVGLYYFLASYAPELKAPTSQQLGYINEAARTPTDNNLARGMIERDLIGTILPVDVNSHDRAWTMEATWRDSLLWMGKPRALDTRLSDWRAAVKSGELPGVIFNATVVESGSPLLFSTVDIPSYRHVIFDEPGSIYHDADIGVLTAVRLSASYAWVTPAASARYVDSPGMKASRFHVVDGGYIDAFGAQAATAWTHDALQLYGDRLGKIVIIQIRARRIFDQPKPDAMSFFVQVLGPVFTVTNALIATQHYRDTAELDDLIADSHGKVDTVVFTAKHGINPSWSLPTQAIDFLDSDWRDLKQGPQMRKLRELLGNQPGLTPFDRDPAPDRASAAPPL